MAKKALGKGLDALIAGPRETIGAHEGVESIKLKDITPNRFQPRKSFDDGGIQELAQSIKANGIIQPIVVAKSKNKFETIVGERRIRASKIAGLTEIPAIVKDASGGQFLDLALIENIQREDLNPIEEGLAYKTILERDRITQEELSNRIGKSRSYIANMIRILDLPDDVKGFVSRGTISLGQAKTLLSLDTAEERKKLTRRILDEKLTVRELESITRKKNVSRGTKVTKKDPYIGEIEERLREKFGTKVMVEYRSGRGSIKIDFYSNDELEWILEEMLG
jgi:ParB family chromosome partitioning protein